MNRTLTWTVAGAAFAIISALAVSYSCFGPWTPAPISVLARAQSIFVQFGPHSEKRFIPIDDPLHAKVVRFAASRQGQRGRFSFASYAPGVKFAVGQVSVNLLSDSVVVNAGGSQRVRAKSAEDLALESELRAWAAAHPSPVEPE